MATGPKWPLFHFSIGSSGLPLGHRGMVVPAKLLRISSSFTSKSQKSISNFFVRKRLKGFQSYPYLSNNIVVAFYICMLNDLQAKRLNRMTWNLKHRLMRGQVRSINFKKWIFYSGTVHSGGISLHCIGNEILFVSYGYG